MEHLQQQAPGRAVALHTKPKLLIFSLTVGALLVGCASQELAPPVAQMARAETAVESAVQAGARDAAPLELQAAQRHLNQAQQANASEDYRQALSFAEKSEADADLAEAKARTEKAYSTVAELKEGIRVLEEELERGYDSRN